MRTRFKKLKTYLKNKFPILLKLDPSRFDLFYLVKFRLLSRHDLQIGMNPHWIEAKKGKKALRISKRHKIYSDTVFASFDYYFDAVKPKKNWGFRNSELF